MKLKNIHTIRSKFFILTTIACLIPFLTLLIYAVKTFSESTLNSNKQNLLQIVDSINWNLNLTTSDIKDISNIIISSAQVQTKIGLNSLTNWDLSEIAISSTTNKNYFNSTIIASPFGSFYSKKSYSSSQYSQQYSNIAMSNVQEYIAESQNPSDNNIWMYWIDGKDFFIPDNSNIFFCRTINNLSTLRKLGILIIGIKKNMFDTVCKNINKNEEYAIYIQNEKGTIYSSNGNENVENYIFENMNNKQKDTISMENIHGEKYLVSRAINSITGWKVYCTFRYNQIYAQQNRIFFISIFIIILVFVSLIITYLITKRITKQISLFTSAIDHFENQEFVKVDFDKKDEVGRLGIRFQTVVQENNKLTVSLYESQLKQKEAELMALQSKINPHFLYNTLNNIYWMAEKIKAHNVSKMVFNLSKFFELALNHGEKYITIENEISLITHYFEIQRARYDNRFSLAIQIPRELYQIKILNILIQPIVENAICHGLELKEGTGLISIAAYKDNSQLLFIVEDNGVGCPPDIDPLNTDGYALKNINERLQINYGKNSGLTFESVLGKGTKVTIRMNMQ